MLEDYNITRCVGTHLPDQIHWSSEGGVMLLFKKELLYLKARNQPDSDPKDIGELVTSYRYSGTLMNWENYLISVLCDNEAIRIGQTKSHVLGQQNDNNPIEVDFSESGVSKSGGPLITVVTDSLNGYLLEEKDGDLKMVSLLNKSIAERETMDINNVLTMDKLGKLRIHSISWVHKIDIDSVTPPVWPRMPENTFIVFTESSTTSLYAINPKTNKPERNGSFDTSLTLETSDDEYVRKSKISDWVHSELDSAILISYVAMITSKNRVILKALNFDTRSKKLFVDSTFTKILDYNSRISAVKFKKVGESQIVLSTVSTNKIKFIILSDKKHIQLLERDLFGNNFQCNSLTQFVINRDADSHVILYTFISDMLSNFIYLKIDLPSKSPFANCGPIYGKKMNYRSVIQATENLPIFDHLNGLRKKGSYRILSMEIDPSGKFLGLLTSLFDRTQPVDGRIVSHHDNIYFSVVPVTKSKLDYSIFHNLNVFSCVQSSPLLKVQTMNFTKYLDRHDADNKTIDVEKQEISDGSIVVPFEDGMSCEAYLQKNLILSPQSEQVRINNTLMTLINQSQDDGNQLRLARSIIELVRTKRVEMSSVYDRLMCRQFLRLLGLPEEGSSNILGDKNNLALPVPGAPDLSETFTFTSNPQRDLISTSITSEEGHTWKVCALTLIPILSPKIRICNYCGSRVLRVPEGFSYGTITDFVLNSLRVCIICGGRYHES